MYFHGTNINMTSKTKDDYTDTSMWLRPEIGEPANVLLITPPDRELTHEVCQRLLTTASYRQEKILAVGYGEKDETWLDKLEYVPSNLTIKWCNNESQSNNDEIVELRKFLSDFLCTTTTSHRIVYFDSLTSIFKEYDSVMVYNICQYLTKQLHTANAVGLFRMDQTAHSQQEIESIAKLFDFTAELKKSSKEWEIKESILH